MSDPDDVAESRPGRRERNRLTRVRLFVDVARRIVDSEGVGALTMQRVADEVDAAVSAIYRYFPSKAALIAELQREAIEDLYASWISLRRDLAVRLGAGSLTARQRSVAGPLAFGRFWIDAHVTHRSQLAFLTGLLEEPDRILPAEEGGRVVPAAVRLLDACRRELEAAARSKALREGDALRRTVLLATALNGVMRTQKLVVWDEELFDSRRLSMELLEALFCGWGARSADLAAAGSALDGMARNGLLPPTAG